MQKRRNVSELIDALLAVAVFGFKDKDLEDLAAGEPEAILRASAIAESMLVIAYEIETRNLSQRDKREAAEFKKFTISFLRNLHKPGIIIRLGHRKTAQHVAGDFRELLRRGGDLCLAICPGRAYQYRLNFGSL